MPLSVRLASRPGRRVVRPLSLPDAAIRLKPYEMLPERAELLVKASIACIKDEIIPLTAEGVAAGSKLFGAAILRGSDLSTVIASTNNELENPLWHGEVHCIKQFYEMPSNGRPSPKDCVFLTTNEPCSLCLSAITWSGFPSFYYLFTYEDSRDLFAIPHDINILEQVYRVPVPSETPDELAKRPLYNKNNLVFTSASLLDLVGSLGDEEKEKKYRQELEALKALYNGLSDTYQKTKGKADIAFA